MVLWYGAMVLPVWCAGMVCGTGLREGPHGSVHLVVAHVERTPSSRVRARVGMTMGDSRRGSEIARGG